MAAIDDGPALPVQDTPCPVPPPQRPLTEYRQLLDSWFFRWPTGTPDRLVRTLVISWLLVLPLCVVVGSGSWTLRHDPIRLLFAAATTALLCPLLLLSRQWLGWSYVRRRLVSERVEYEESGWYDGQVWEKPIAWRQQDLLVARHQVEPVLGQLRRSALVCAALLLAGAGLCQAF